MKFLYQSSFILVTVLFVSTAFAQSTPVDKAASKAERQTQAVEAAKSFVPGEGNPKPAPRAKVGKADRIAASEARKPEGQLAARNFRPGEGDPKPEASVKMSRAERSAARESNRNEVAKLNKAGQLPSFSDNYGGK